MRKIYTIIRREYKETVYKKGFLISTILTPIILMGLIFIPALLTGVDLEEQVIFDVIDFSRIVYDDLVVKLDIKLSDGSQKYVLNKIEISPENWEFKKEELKQRISLEESDGFILIPANAESLKTDPVEFYARNTGNIDLNRQLQSTISGIVIDQRIRQSGLEPDIVNKLTKRMDFRAIKITKSAEEKEGGFLESYFSTLGLVMILYMTILVYGSTIMRGVIQEKNSRVIEVLLSSTNSFQLMVGKIIGLGSIGLTQYLIWSVFGILILTYGQTMIGENFTLLSLSPSIFIYFVIFFVLGYFLFATLYAGVGALTNSDQEAQQLSLPLVFLLIIPLILMTFIVKNPDSTISVVLSLIPFFSPILMFARINVAPPPFYEILISIILTLILIVIFMWIVAKVYRIGILMYGKRPTLPEIMRWIKAK